MSSPKNVRYDPSTKAESQSYKILEYSGSWRKPLYRSKMEDLLPFREKRLSLWWTDHSFANENVWVKHIRLVTSDKVTGIS